MWLYYIKINKNGTPKDIQLTLRKAGKKKGKQKTNRTSKKWKIKIGRSKLSDHELLIAKFRLKWNKVGKTTRPFRYDLNQIPYDYTVAVRNRFKGLDLIDRVPDEPWTEVPDIVPDTGSQGKNTKVVYHSLLQWTTFCLKSPPWPIHLGGSTGHGS